MKDKVFFAYKIDRNNDGTYKILQKDLTSKKVKIHSLHDSFDEASDELSDIKSKPSQTEVLRWFKDLKNTVEKI